MLINPGVEEKITLMNIIPAVKNGDGSIMEKGKVHL